MSLKSGLKMLTSGSSFSLAVLLLGLLNLPQHSSGHRQPESAAEIEAYARAQQDLYHCYPAMARYLDARQSAWSQDPSSGFLDQQSNPNLTPQTRFALGTSTESDPVLSCRSPETDERVRNQSCVLSPVVTQGPYYHFSDHPIRQNMAEWQDGLLFMIDIGVIDVKTCEPIPNALVDIWHANATGFYAGHPVSQPHLTNEEPQRGGKRSGLLTAFPRTNLQQHWLRAAWPTNLNGVSQFTSIFPGYYTGRATHVHAKVHLDWTQHENQTFSSQSSQYVGQFFFPDDLNLAIDRMSPYRFNPVLHRTRNWRDSLKIFDESNQNGFDPMFEIHKLGGVLSQGLVGFITVGIDRGTVIGHDWQP